MPVSINGQTGVITGLAVGGLPDGIIQTADLADDAVTIAKLSTTGTASGTTFLRGDGAFAAAGGGKFLQIVGAVDGSNMSSTTSSSYQDTGMSVNITTSASGHAGVFAMVSGNIGGLSNTSGGEAVGIMRLVRDSTELIYANHGAWAGNVSGARTQDYSNVAMNFYDTGTSASTTYTYKVQFKKHSDTDNATWNYYNGKSSIYLIEVGA